MTGNQGFRVDPRGVVPRQNSGTFDFHLGNNVTNLSRNSLIFKVARHFGEAQLSEKREMAAVLTRRDRPNPEGREIRLANHPGSGYPPEHPEIQPRRAVHLFGLAECSVCARPERKIQESDCSERWSPCRPRRGARGRYCFRDRIKFVRLMD